MNEMNDFLLGYSVKEPEESNIVEKKIQIMKNCLLNISSYINLHAYSFDRSYNQSILNIRIQIELDILKRNCDIDLGIPCGSELPIFRSFNFEQLKYNLENKIKKSERIRCNIIESEKKHKVELISFEEFKNRNI